MAVAGDGGKDRNSDCAQSAPMRAHDYEHGVNLPVDTGDDSQIVPAMPARAQEWAGDASLGLRAYANLLCGTGVTHGLIGPREVPRIWERHVLNCAVIASSIPQNASVADVGSGAGLPGLVLALMRPDLEVTLIEPLERRTRWLEAAISELPCTATVLRARAEDCSQSFSVVTSRAVAGVQELSRLCLPLVKPGGMMLAMKGERVHEELASAQKLLEFFQVGKVSVLTCGKGIVNPQTTLLSIDVPQKVRALSKRKAARISATR